MRTSPKRQWLSEIGFTLTELSVLVGAGALLSSLLLADLTQTQQKFLQQSCAANMKQWGVAMELYSQDYRGSLYYDVGGLHFDEPGSPLLPYVGARTTTDIRNLRICPARAAALPQLALSTGVYSYNMPVGTYRRGLSYANADTSASPYYSGNPPSYWPNLKSCRNPSQLLLLIECNGHTLHAGGLLPSAITVLGLDPDQVPPIYRHGGLINCLFGDLHVELVTTNTLHAQDALAPTSPWFELN
ncbi:MAG TPA: hypothetical protein VMP11_19960 [Verrucomicrobiae bacterium]|nr:hypothetical protein [Verrucomicrobiae bacterium]